MRRALFAVSLALVVGCGKSFQEADAIYKDEVAKLERIGSEMQSAMDAAGNEGEKNRIFSRYNKLLAAQEAKVKEAEKQKEAAK